MQHLLIGDFDNIPKCGNPCWDSVRIRRECIAGTNRELAAYILAGYVLEPTKHPFDARLEEAKTMQELAAWVSAKHNINLAALRGPGRSRYLVKARAEFCKLAQGQLGRSVSDIGRYLHRDHTSVLYLIKRHDGLHIDWKRRIPLTHCKAGHEYTPENTFITPNTGKRQCLICNRAYWERRKQAYQERRQERRKCNAS